MRTVFGQFSSPYLNQGTGRHSCLLGHLVILFKGPVKPRHVGAVAARNQTKSPFSQWVLSMTRT